MDKTHFIIFLENYEKNKEKIEKGPYIRQMDLAITCHQMILLKEKEMYTSHVTWEALQAMDISPEELFHQAGMDSRELLPPTLDTLKDILIDYIAQSRISQNGETLKEALDHAEQDYYYLIGSEDEDLPRLYVVSNELKVRGAGVVFYSDILSEFANEIESDLILLPSSIHEWIVISASEASEPEALKSIVRDANQFVVLEHEVLSENVYCYSRKNDRIEVLRSMDV